MIYLERWDNSTQPKWNKNTKPLRDGVHCNYKGWQTLEKTGPTTYRIQKMYPKPVRLRNHYYLD